MDIDVNDDTQVDALLNHEAPSADVPMRGEPAPTSWTEDKFSVGGKEIKGTREQILKWAEMGYNYPQRAQELNQQKATWEKQLAELKAREAQWADAEKRFGPYREVDEYAAKNPQWWEQVQTAYQQARSNGAPANPEIEALKAKLSEYDKRWADMDAEKSSIRVKEEDTKLSQEVESIRKQYANVDFDTPDENGKSLEMRILEHAEQNGISSFRVAYRDYYHDQLVSKARDEGKEAHAKNVQKQTKLGILGESSKPTRGLQVAKNVKEQSYESLMQEALDELQSGRAG